MMNFYELSHPDYISDRLDRFNNPVNLITNISVPSIICNECGLWSSSERIRKEIELTPKAKDILEMRSVHVNEWEKVITNLSCETGIDKSIIKPGAEIGFPKAEVVNTKLNDFIHPFPGMVWVNREVMESLLRIGVKGIIFTQVQAIFKDKTSMEKCSPNLWELTVLSSAWRKGSNFEKILVCNKCKRTVFPDPEFLEVDEVTWNGADFFYVDMNPNIIMVTERVKKIIEEKGFTNVIFKDV